MRLLLVEDDTSLAEGILTSLKNEGYTLDWLKDGTSALHALSSEPFDLAILDLGLPRMDGLTVLRALRDRHHAVPVLILTARDGVQDRIAGLDADWVLPGHGPACRGSPQVAVEAVPGEEREETFYVESVTGGLAIVVRAAPVRREVTKRVLPKALVEKLPGTVYVLDWHETHQRFGGNLARSHIFYHHTHSELLARCAPEMPVYRSYLMQDKDGTGAYRRTLEGACVTRGIWAATVEIGRNEPFADHMGVRIVERMVRTLLEWHAG